MAKIVRAFSIDPEVSQAIDELAQRYSTWDKKPNKSRLVNQACRWYFMTDLAEEIEMKDSQAQYWKDKYLSNQGGKGLLARFLSVFRSSP